MKTTMIINILVLACLLVGAAAGAADPAAAAGAHRRALLTTRRLRGGGRRQLWGEKFWKKMPSTGAPGIGESVKATYSAYCDRFVEKSEEAAKPLSAKIKAINDQAATPKPLSAIVNLRAQALGVFNDPQLHWIRFDAPMQSGCGATGCMCKPGSHSQEFDDVVIGVRDEVVASLAAQPLVCPVVQEAIKRVIAGTGSDFCPGIHTSGAGVMSSYKAKAAQACGSLRLAANDPLLTGVAHNESRLAAAIAARGPVGLAVTACEWGTVTTTPQKPMARCHSADGACGHFVTVVGYNADGVGGGPPYWVVRNHWGSTWGDEGYVYLQMGLACGSKYGCENMMQNTPSRAQMAGGNRTAAVA